jgi:NADPH-dependent 2,4-dienoyl-CoA reductase/sulfur reductase-like enzyme/nitrite reductase/ring-hydroxylating ferredoxin subunit
VTTHSENPDLVTEGIALADLSDGKIVAGHYQDQPVMLIRNGGEVFALGARCTHYEGPLAEGLFDGECVRCPWHHAAFAVRTGEPARAPALNAVTTYAVEERNGRVYVTGEAKRDPEREPITAAPESVVIVGAGAAGNAAAEMLRREGYDGPITIIGREQDIPYDRPNLSKDYLAGKAQEDWIPLRSREFYAEQRIDLRLGTRAERIDTDARSVVLADGQRIDYGALLLATGADPVRLDIPDADLPHVFTLRSYADSRAIIEASKQARSVVVVGASFIGLEVAASLRERDLEVHVVAPSERPMQNVLGPEFGDFVRALHEQHGVQFHLQRKPASISRDAVTLDDGTRVEAQLVVVGIGVRPALALAEGAGITTDRGVLVNEYLATNVPGIWAAGDIASWPDRHTGQRIRVEHWVVAERAGQAAARNILGRKEPFDDVPFFWSQHYDVTINYVGHAQRWDRIDVSGSMANHDCIAAFRADGKTLAVASIFRDLDSLRAELAMERGDIQALEALVASSR